MLVGRLVRDAELVQLENNTRGIIKFVLAVNKNFPNKNGEREADFIPIIYWTDHGDKIQNYLSKGMLIGVSGQISIRNYTTSEGTKRYITQVEADSFQFLESKKEKAV
jgi:single-strand DNA-binding protein